MAVVIETEYEPARTVEADALARLGRILEPEGELMEAALAVRIPGELGEAPGNLESGIRRGTFSFCTFSGTRLHDDPARRWPRSDWLRGGIDELADCIEHVSLSEQRIDQGAEILERAVRNTARTLQIPARRAIAAYWIFKARPAGDDPGSRRGRDPRPPDRDRRGTGGHRRDDPERSLGSHVPAADRRPEVPRYVLHPAVERPSAGRAGGRPSRRRLGERRRRAAPSDRRLRLWHRRRCCLPPTTASPPGIAAPAATTAPCTPR